MLFLIVCNGGSSHILSVEDVDETVQQRMIKLMIDNKYLTNPYNAEKIIDFQMLGSIIDKISSSIVADIGLLTNKHTSPRGKDGS